MHRLCGLGRRAPAVVATVLLAAVQVAAGAPRVSSAVDDGFITVQSAGNDLLVRRRAPVSYTTLEEATVGIQTSMSPRAGALRLIRSSPAQMIEYVLGVTRDGTLLVGEQVRLYDFDERRYVFSRGEIARAYRPLETLPPWRWLLDVAVSREAAATLELRADGAWPLESVTITPLRMP